jgi:hypothetical protein
VKLHPLLAFVSVLGGIQVMGLWGIFIGPIVASCLHALIKIFNTELVAFSEEKQGRPTPDESTLPLPAGGSETASADVKLDGQQTTVPSPPTAVAVSPVPTLAAAPSIPPLRKGG